MDLGAELPPAEFNLEATEANSALYKLLMSRSDVTAEVCDRVFKVDGFELGLRLATAIIADPHGDPSPVVLPRIDEAARYAREQMVQEREFAANRARENKA